MLRTYFKRLLRLPFRNTTSSRGPCSATDETGLDTISISRMITGKFCIKAQGALPFRKDAVRCLLQATTTSVQFDAGKFTELMQSQGIPDYIIDAYLETISVTEETRIADYAFVK